MIPSVGRIVHFVGEDGRHYAAVVTRVWTNACVNLFVFPAGDATQPRPEQASVMADETMTTASTWHWPEVLA